MSENNQTALSAAIKKEQQPVQNGQSRYISSELDSSLHTLMIQAGGIAGAALAVMNIDTIVDTIGFGSNSMTFLIAFGIAGYLLGNICTQIVILLFNDLAAPFVPNGMV